MYLAHKALHQCPLNVIHRQRESVLVTLRVNGFPRVCLSATPRPHGVYATSADRQRHPHHDYRKVGRKIVDYQIQFGAAHV